VTTTDHPEEDPMSSTTATSPVRASHTGRTSPEHSARAPRPGARMGTALRPLLIDVGVPLGSYYLLRDGFGLSLWLSLALSSVGPAIRSVAGLVGERKLNVLALLMLAVNLAGIAVSFLTGDPRAMIAKDSVISSVIAFAILASVIARRPLMSAGLRPFMTQGTPERSAVWDRLATGSARFRRFELLYSTIWGVALLADCAARLVGAYTLPVTTMVWMSTVLTLSAIGVGVMVGGAVAAMPILRMIETEVGGGDGREPAEDAARQPSAGRLDPLVERLTGPAGARPAD
jgi:hypothetical protein